MIEIQNYINGEFEKGEQTLPNISPMNGEIYSTLPNSTAEEVNKAVLAAKNAFVEWSSLKNSEREEYLLKFARYIENHFAEFAEAEAIDSGKPIRLARTMDIPRAIQNFQFFAELIANFQGETFHTNEHVMNYTEYSPLGVVGCISPWNLPLYLLTWKIAPALVVGNTVVAKPSELTPMTAYLLSRAAQAIGLPKGVLNIVHGLGPTAGSALVTHPEVKAISFTGSTDTGRFINQAAAAQFKKVSLEMGGKNANIIFADCDFDKMVSTSLRSSFQNQGQICLCGSRIFIEETIYEKFREHFVAGVQKLKQLPSLHEEADQAAVVSEAHMNKVLSYIELAKKEGGRILTGGKKAELHAEYKNMQKGYYIEPTVIEGLPASSRVNQEEIFGPVVTLIPFREESEVISMANSTRYGLSATVWTQDIQRAHRVASLLQAGVVWINTWLVRDLRTPFGGVKDSGVGREGGLYGLRFFTEVKNICLDTKKGLEA